MTEFDFDAPVDRREVPALKTHPIVLGENAEHLFPAGVADMDFQVAPPILDALQRRIAHGVFGYEAVPDGLLPALNGWLQRRHSWDVSQDHILRSPNALNSLAIAASIFSKPDGGIIVQPPVFFDFFDVIHENGRRVVQNPLLLKNDRYSIDFGGLEELASDPTNEILFLCNPHNPVGRVWTREELCRLSAICNRYDVLVVADELHGDIVYPGHAYVPFASLDERAAQNSVTILSPAKTFNIASCCSAFTVIPNKARRAAFQCENSRLTVNKNNAFANVAMEAAFREGEPWLDGVMDYLLGNLALLRERVSELPGVRLIEPEGTFLAWLDFRQVNLSADELHSFLRNEAFWSLSRGTSFGKEGDGFMRLNFACRRDRLDAALRRLSKSLTKSD